MTNAYHINQILKQGRVSGKDVYELIQAFLRLPFGSPDDTDDLKGRVYAGYRSFQTVTATGNIGDNEVTYIDATAGDVTSSLPDPALVAGRTFAVKRTDASGSVVTVNARNGGTIDGAANFTLASQKSKTLHSNGVEYKTIGAF